MLGKVGKGALKVHSGWISAGSEEVAFLLLEVQGLLFYSDRECLFLERRFKIKRVLPVLLKKL
jgi:hypothetical protein